jgi:hypothetical protein
MCEKERILGHEKAEKLLCVDTYLTRRGHILYSGGSKPIGLSVRSKRTTSTLSNMYLHVLIQEGVRDLQRGVRPAIQPASRSG